MRMLFSSALLIVLTGPAPALADQEMTATNGSRLEMPDIAALDCERMDRLLVDYARAEYRGLHPVPDGHPDRPIYDYENALARRHYMVCQSDPSSYDTPVEAFGRGFN